jgi:hypothetical protein
MKREILILNVVCLALALAFIGFAVWNFWSNMAAFNSLSELWASFYHLLTIDNLFTTAFCLLMALIFISIPASWMVTTGVVKIPFMSASSDSTEGKASLPAGARTTTAAIGPGNAAATNAALPARREIQKDAKGRPIPADVQSMVAEMNKSEQKTP